MSNEGKTDKRIDESANIPEVQKIPPRPSQPSQGSDSGTGSGDKSKND